MHIRQAVILAGGEGRRLLPLTLTTPKPLIEIGGKPFAEYLIEMLVAYGIEEIIFLTGYLGEQFPEWLGDGSRWGIRILYSQSPTEDDTGTRLRKAKQLLGEQFLLLYGDNYCPIDFKALVAFHEKMGLLATVTVYERNDPKKKNNMRVVSGIVEVYDKKGETPGLQGIDIGFFVLSRRVLDLLPEENANFEYAILPKLISQKQLAGFITKEPYQALTSPERLPAMEVALKKFSPFR